MNEADDVWALWTTIFYKNYLEEYRQFKKYADTYGLNCMESLVLWHTLFCIKEFRERMYNKFMEQTHVYINQKMERKK